MKYGLKENIIEDIKKVFSVFPEVEDVVLYGSRAKGNYKNGSDIDLAIKGSNINGKLLNKISLLLDGLYLPYTFDITAYNQIDNPALIGHIERVGVSLV